MRCSRLMQKALVTLVTKAARFLAGNLSRPMLEMFMSQTLFCIVGNISCLSWLTVNVCLQSILICDGDLKHLKSARNPYHPIVINVKLFIWAVYRTLAFKKPSLTALYLMTRIPAWDIQLQYKRMICYANL